jgi:hypothetical protein
VNGKVFDDTRSMFNNRFEKEGNIELVKKNEWRDGYQFQAPDKNISAFIYLSRGG